MNMLKLVRPSLALLVLLLGAACGGRNKTDTTANKQAGADAEVSTGPCGSADGRHGVSE